MKTERKRPRPGLFYTTRSKLIACFMGAVLLVGLVCLYVGGQLLYKSVHNEATTRVKLNLNAAREIYEGRIELIQVTLRVTSLGTGFLDVLGDQDIQDLVLRLRRLAAYAGLDFAGIVTRRARPCVESVRTPWPPRSRARPTPSFRP